MSGDGQEIEHIPGAFLDVGVVYFAAKVGELDKELHVLFVERQDDGGQHKFEFNVGRIDDVVCVLGPAAILVRA